MKELHIRNTTYKLEDAAYDKLEQYLESVRTHFASEPEVILDIEMACIELLDEVLIERADKRVTETDVTSLIQKLGTVAMIEEQATEETKSIRKRLYRDTDNKWIAGVASGLAAYFGIPVWTVRLAFIIALIAPIPSIIPYLILWVVMPKAKTKADQLRMHGVPVSLSSLSQSTRSLKDRVISLAKLSAIALGFLIIFALVAFTLLGAYLAFNDSQYRNDGEPNRNVYEYACESGDSIRLLQAESGEGTVLIVGDKEDMHQGEYALLSESNTTWTYGSPSLFEPTTDNGRWKFELNKQSLNVTATDNATGEQDICVVTTMRASSQNQPSALENLADFTDVDKCLDTGAVWDASERRCLSESE